MNACGCRTCREERETTITQLRAALADADRVEFALRAIIRLRDERILDLEREVHHHNTVTAWTSG